MDSKKRNVLSKRFKIDGTLGERLLALRKMRKLTQRDLAKIIRVSHVTISQWESGDSEPSGSNLIALSFALECSPTGLMYGIDFDSVEAEVQPNTLCIRYPVLTSLQASRLEDPLDVNTLKDIKLWFESDAPLEGDGFWTLVDNDSMTAPVGISIPVGTYVLYDFSREAVNGDFVLAKLNKSASITFKQFVTDGEHKFLKALNPAWPLIQIDDGCEIIGVAVETKLRFVKNND
ncbi:helix-turn-helix domain-containing protein [Rouxiella badensis]|jgi:SOS-response transcriptional repressor LexA|uniref:S24 family peptidase n=1 Tax=Rouxiella badensis TaxID=1646377 RepID=UPI0013EF3647|nr:S24 family peptidase [Rouxiella badensis]MCC3719296.1 helix-turn-helix domain-containing protein [Rouxiella badensis]MCC3728546.1 helix-turn-helix domain-containing protein [Rouxiella badensis]MCC3735986.1 helix-turn-helix domain-containing protein [Rouxiella badensis]MCC3739458.1 helix-turn-helix domain-containing protein [Rouxiella badensis]MCC3761383.1 helix-turn-helix domain-containing protein [Rouxiella badensis]